MFDVVILGELFVTLWGEELWVSTTEDEVLANHCRLGVGKVRP